MSGLSTHVAEYELFPENAQHPGAKAGVGVSVRALVSVGVAVSVGGGGVSVAVGMLVVVGVGGTSPKTQLVLPPPSIEWVPA